ncbi:MAG TPA: TolC family protein [Candidatus Eisenbacteria bacterium]|nr:TolC family protein [Candidatus Eisenbacteria bacterium]
MRNPWLLGALVAVFGASPAFAQHDGMRPSGAITDSLALLPVLSLNTLERLVVRQNADVEAARQAYQAALKVPGTSGWEDPQLEFALGPASLNRDDFATAYRVGLRQAIPLGKLGSQRDVAKREAEASAADLDVTLNDVLRTARESYAEYARASATGVVIVEMRQVVEQLRRVALSRYAAGLVGEADALMAESELAMLDHEAIKSENDVARSTARMNALLHRSWDASLPLPPTQLDAPGPVPELRALVEAAWVERPEILAAASRYRADEARVRVAESARVPRLEFMAAYDRFWQEDPLRPMVGVSVSVPIFSGPRSAAEGEAKASLNEARAKQVSVTDQVAYQVQSAYLDVEQSAHEAQLVRETQLPVAQRALGAARAGYESGKNDFGSLLQAERDLTEARLMELKALGEYHAARAELAWAVGKLPPWVGTEGSKP